MTAVLAANLFTAMFIYGAINFTKKEKEGEWDWTYWGCIGLPLVLAVAGLIIGEELPLSPGEASAQ